MNAQTAAGAQRVGGQDPKPVARHRQHARHRHAARCGGRVGRRFPPRRRWWSSSRRPATCWRSAQNAAADAQGPIALTGLYPPGSTFKTVTVSAALQAGQVTPDSVVRLPRHREHRGPPDPQRRQLRPRRGAAAHRVRAVVQHHDGPAGGQPAARRPDQGRRAAGLGHRLHRAGDDHRHRQGARRRHRRAAGGGGDRAGPGDRVTVRHGAGGRRAGPRFGARARDRRRASPGSPTALRIRCRRRSPIR